MASMSSLSLIQIINLLHYESTYPEEMPETICEARLFVQKILEKGLENISSDARILLLFFEKQVLAACQCKKMERCKVHLRRKSLQKETGWSNERLELSLEELMKGYYLRVHQKERSLSYELLYDSARSRRSHYVMEPTGASKID